MIRMNPMVASSRPVFTSISTQTKCTQEQSLRPIDNQAELDPNHTASPMSLVLLAALASFMLVCSMFIGYVAKNYFALKKL